MEILLNNQTKELPGYEHITAEQLVELTFPDFKNGIALAIGERVISKSEWQQQIIRANDEVLIFKATQGG